MDESRRKKFVAIIRRLKDQKGLTMKASEYNHEIKQLKEKQKEINKIKEEHKDIPAIVEKADDSNKKLQTIINDLNDFMKVLHPEGLIDYGNGEPTPVGNS